jgi:hypothetical protein
MILTPEHVCICVHCVEHRPHTLVRAFTYSVERAMALATDRNVSTSTHPAVCTTLYAYRCHAAGGPEQQGSLPVHGWPAGLCRRGALLQVRVVMKVFPMLWMLCCCATVPACMQYRTGFLRSASHVQELHELQGSRACCLPLETSMLCQVIAHAAKVRLFAWQSLARLCIVSLQV